MPESQALLCYEKAVHAIVFVHGWGGGAGKTWEMFPEIVAKAAPNADIFFLDYPSMDSQVSFCAVQLLRFLKDLVNDPMHTIVEPSLPSSAPRRGQATRYQRIFLVGHSMGAVVCRRALIALDQSPPDGLTDDDLGKFRLLFFAPAHCGSAIPLLIGSGLGLDYFPAAKLVGSLMVIWLQSLRDLAENSLFLANLAKDSQRLREERTKRSVLFSHLRAKVYHAHNDRVVIQNEFDQDPPFNPVMGKTHRSICKPTEYYLTPAEALDALLKT
ncbi:alpha/beta hydrolase [Bradyrhizobium sp. 146]|uniref:esterase/lipase family protein n=1 Tax=Bradyrhizobium sp. 146 TaxID=2782622 RepID=UPI001FF80C8B|nr:alpha/beta hydrolase [Bradyrhizobium sp. 146]MCK1705218.1 alpha/beta hydrolase [Bradyrhizobium sp. 146]